ncbi:MAG: hypothetical protein KC496_00385 [Anaerolineae bacterium]|nr:hypothetical protein [Anaerolineae bacterium]
MQFQPIRISPQYALIFTYDIRPGLEQRYNQFASGEFVMTMQQYKLYRQYEWHILGSDEPQWQVEFITEKLSHIRDLFDDPQWPILEERLRRYTRNYARRLVRFHQNIKIMR